jgi:uncharacterized protein
MEFIFISIILALTAMAYSSVGLGGGTAYLALLSFWQIDPLFLRPIAWELNIICSIITFWNYYTKGHFDFRSSLPYLCGGVTGAMIGAAIIISTPLFRILLAFTLLAASFRMITQSDNTQINILSQKKPSFIWSFLLSLLIGILSGLVGIGGGIILGPILISLKWINIKNCAALTSCYILLCSISALVTHSFTQGSININTSFIFGAAVLAGGFIGSQFGSSKASPALLRKIFAVIVLIAALNISIDLVKSLLY